jgi:hypothetical protein
MDKYSAVTQDVLSIFGTPAWKAENIKTFPANFVAIEPGNEYVRVTVIPGGRGINRRSLSGILIIDIFIPAGNGQKRASFIADKLDSYLDSKTISASNDYSIQCSQSALSFSGIDADNPTLYRATYTIPFNLFGVF